MLRGLECLVCLPLFFLSPVVLWLLFRFWFSCLTVGEAPYFAVLLCHSISRLKQPINHTEVRNESPLFPSCLVQPVPCLLPEESETLCSFVFQTGNTGSGWVNSSSSTQLPYPSLVWFVYNWVMVKRINLYSSRVGKLFYQCTWIRKTVPLCLNTTRSLELVPYLYLCKFFLILSLLKSNIVNINPATLLHWSVEAHPILPIAKPLNLCALSSCAFASHKFKNFFCKAEPGPLPLTQLDFIPKSVKCLFHPLSTGRITFHCSIYVPVLTGKQWLWLWKVANEVHSGICRFLLFGHKKRTCMPAEHGN